MFKYLSLDTRSLALGRISIATVLIFDWFYRFFNSFDFYSDWGVLPRGPSIGELANPYFFSVFNMAGKPIYIYAFLLIGLIFHLGLLVGYRTKLSNVLSWVFFVSLSARMPLVSHAGDDLMRLALFWLIFLPTNQHFSADRALTNLHQQVTTKFDNQILNTASFALMLQLISMYFFTGLLKWHPVWTTEGSALYLALELEQFLTPFGELLRLLPYEILQFLTRIVLYSEIIIPLLVFIPFKNHYFRFVSIVTFVFFHLGLFATFKLGNFPWICIAYWMIFVPGHFWDYVLESLQKQQQSVTIYFDPECALCKKMTYLIKTFLVLPFVQIKAGSDAVVLNHIKQNNSWVISDSENKFYFSYNAFLKLLSVSVFSKMLFIFQSVFFRKIGHFVYLKISTDRKKYLSFLNYFQIRKPLNYKLSWWTHAFVVLCFSVATFWNVALHNEDDKIQLNSTVRTIGSVFRLHQNWVMFAPYPAFEDGWVVVDGLLKNGKTWDIFNDQPLSYDKPQHLSDMFKNSLWRKYLSNIRDEDYKNYRLYFGRFLCRLWNDKNNDNNQVDSLKIYYMLDRSNKITEPPNPIKQELLWSHGCFVK